MRFLVNLMTFIDEIAPIEGRRYAVNFMPHSMIRKHPDFVGVWTVYEPNALDGRDTTFVNTPEATL